MNKIRGFRKDDKAMILPRTDIARPLFSHIDEGRKVWIEIGGTSFICPLSQWDLLVQSVEIYRAKIDGENYGRKDK